jgi:hypothetical protein
LKIQKKILLTILLGLAFSFTGFSQSCLPDGIIFSTQAQIDNFQENFPNCTQIEGWVIIGASGTDITNLNGLSDLTSIGGNLDISGNNLLTNLTGLDNVCHIGGYLSIGGYQYGGNDALISLTGLEGLTSIEGDLVIIGNYALTNLDGLCNLEATSIEALKISQNSSLSDCAIQSICNYLANINGPVDIYNNGIGCQSPHEIANACGLTSSCLPYGNYYFESQAEIDSFQVNYPGCTELQGEVWINFGGITNLNGFNEVISISNSLVLWNTYSLSSLAGLDQLNYVGNWFYILGDDSLTNLTGLGNLSTVGGWFEISHNDGLSDLTGLDSLQSIGQGLDIDDNSSLSSLTGLENLNCVEGSISITNNSGLTSLMGLNYLTSLGGFLSIDNNDALYDLSGLDSLVSIGNPGINIENNDALVSLSGLNSLNSVKGVVHIIDNNVLTSISGIENINPDLITDLSIKNNTSLSDCAVQSICEYLSSPNGYVYIENNATDCNSGEQIIAVCEMDLNEYNEGYSNISLYPNPTLGQITIETSLIHCKSQLSMFNIEGQLLIEKWITDPLTVIDISYLPEGVYFARFTSGSALKMFKVLKY